MFCLIKIFFYFLYVSYKMKTIRKLNIKVWSGYFFEEMANISDIHPECFIVGNVKECTNGTMLYNIYYSDKTGAHIVFNNIDCYFKKMVTIVL